MNDYFNVSGVDRNEGARVVFVMCRSGAADGYVRVGSGHIVGVDGGFVPPGIEAGQFRITFRLPYGCSPSTIIVKDDKDAELTRDIKVTPCEVSSIS
jgi:hypothetical protein